MPWRHQPPSGRACRSGGCRCRRARAAAADRKVPAAGCGSRRMTMAAASTLSPEDGERFRSFERQRHDYLARTYRDFFTPITALAIEPLFDAIRFKGGIDLLDVATGPGSLAAEAHRLGAKTVGVDLSPGMIELATKS